VIHHIAALSVADQSGKSCWFRQPRESLLQLGVLRLGLLQDGDAGVGVFPEGENRSGELFVTAARLSAPTQQIVGRNV
jgi:hypothetical protein